MGFLKCWSFIPRLPKSVHQRCQEAVFLFGDPTVIVCLVHCGLFLFLFVLYPLLCSISNGFLEASKPTTSHGSLSLKYFLYYFDSYHGPHYRAVFLNTLEMGLVTATSGTMVAFILAYTVVRCNVPFKRLIHILAVVPIMSPPFSTSLTTILLFGRNGLVTRKLLGMTFYPGENDIYGMDGLVFTQVISFFPVAYLIIKNMLDRLDPSLEEAARTFGASKFYVFRTLTVPLLTPGIASSFVLLFVESLADLGNPLLIGGNTTVLSTQIYLAVIGEYDYQKASTLALVLLTLTLLALAALNFHGSRRSYITITGKPPAGMVLTQEQWCSKIFAIVAYSICLLVLLLYLTLVVSSFTAAWGIDYTLTARWWKHVINRGLESVMDTVFLSAVATPIAGFTGMVLAFIMVRKLSFSKSLVDFTSNLGAAVPGTVLGLGFVLAFNSSPTLIVIVLYVVLTLFFVGSILNTTREKFIVALLGSVFGLTLAGASGHFSEKLLFYIIGGAYIGVGLILLIESHRWIIGSLFTGLGFYLVSVNLIEYAIHPLVYWSSTTSWRMSGNVFFQICKYIRSVFQIPTPVIAIPCALASAFAAYSQQGVRRPLLVTVLLGMVAALCFVGKPMVLIGTPYIIIAAYAARSLPGSLRAVSAALQQVDLSLEEASGVLGAGSYQTFRKVALPLIWPAILAGLTFSFTRHAMSFSAIILLVSPRWRIVTASILNEWEQGGISVAGAYCTAIILLVLLCLAILYLVVNILARRCGGTKSVARMESYVFENR